MNMSMDEAKSIMIDCVEQALIKNIRKQMQNF